MNALHIPSTLDAVNRNKHLGTLDGILAIKDPQAILPVVGDCLERAGVEDGGWVAVDFTRFPAPPRYKTKGGDGSFDLCLCYGTLPGQNAPTVMVKAYDGVWGSWHMVGTRFAGRWATGVYRMDYSVPAKRVFGVVFASWGRDGRLKWQRDPAGFPPQLDEVPSILGGIMGEPIGCC